MGGHVTIYYVALAITAIAAYWWGSTCERIGVSIAITGSTITTAISIPSLWYHLSIPVFIIDLFVLAGFWSLAFFSSRFWPYWATGWQLVGTLVHVQRAVFDDILEKPYGLLSMYIAYPILGVILAASLLVRNSVLNKNIKDSSLEQKNGCRSISTGIE
jgi:hypothetical protein